MAAARNKKEFHHWVQNLVIVFNTLSNADMEDQIITLAERNADVFDGLNKVLGIAVTMEVTKTTRQKLQLFREKNANLARNADFIPAREVRPRLISLSQTEGWSNEFWQTSLSYSESPPSVDFSCVTPAIVATTSSDDGSPTTANEIENSEAAPTDQALPTATDQALPTAQRPACDQASYDSDPPITKEALQGTNVARLPCPSVG